MNRDTITMTDLLASYNNLNIGDKRRELGREIAELTVIVQKLLNDIGEGENLSEKTLDQFNNLYDATLTEDKYLTGLYEDVLNFKDLLGLYFIKTTLHDYNE